MSSAEHGEPSFRIVFSGTIAEAIRQLQWRASLQGRGEQFLQALRSVVARLQSDPHELGEPLYRLPALRMQVRCAVIRPLSVDFAICEDRPLVFIKAVRLLAAQDR